MNSVSPAEAALLQARQNARIAGGQSSISPDAILAAKTAAGSTNPNQQA
jgi:hypothetical protein